MTQLLHPTAAALREFRRGGWATPPFCTVDSLQACEDALPEYKKPVRLLRAGDHPVVGGLLVRHKADLKSAWSTLRPRGPLLMRREPPGARLWCARPSTAETPLALWECVASMGELRAVESVRVDAYPSIGEWVDAWLSEDSPRRELEPNLDLGAEPSSRTGSRSSLRPAQVLPEFEGWFFGANGPNACLLGVGLTPSGATSGHA